MDLEVFLKTINPREIMLFFLSLKPTKVEYCGGELWKIEGLKAEKLSAILKKYPLIELRTVKLTEEDKNKIHGILLSEALNL